MSGDTLSTMDSDHVVGVVGDPSVDAVFRRLVEGRGEDAGSVVRGVLLQKIALDGDLVVYPEGVGYVDARLVGRGQRARV